MGNNKLDIDDTGLATIANESASVHEATVARPHDEAEKFIEETS